MPIVSIASRVTAARLTGERAVRLTGERAVIRIGHALAASPGSNNASRSDSRPDNDMVRVLGGPLRGVTLVLPGVERASMVAGTYEHAVARALRQHLRPGDVAYDVGAHVGYLSLVMARLVGPRGRVVAFEANPDNQRSLATNFARIAPNVAEMVPTAVSDHTGIVRFATFGYSLVGHIETVDTPTDAHVVTTPCVTLDEYVYGRSHPAPALVKVDVEGAEAQVLRGGWRLLNEHRPVVIVEARLTDEWWAVASNLARVGYHATTLHRWDNNMRDLLLLPPQ